MFQPERQNRLCQKPFVSRLCFFEVDHATKSITLCLAGVVKILKRLAFFCPPRYIRNRDQQAGDVAMDNCRVKDIGLNGDCLNVSNPIHFGTGGWRAIIGDDFVRGNICRVGYGVARMLIEDGQTDKPVVIGYDRRFLSDSAAGWLAQVFAACGIKVWLMKRSAPSPLIMHTVKKCNLHCGLEVTASHNPPAFNGIKLIIHEGRDASVEVTQRLESLINSYCGAVPEMDFKTAVSERLISYLKNPFNDFIDDIVARLDMKAIRERGLRIAFDPMHGSGTYPLLVILYTARCTVDMINQNKDAYFGSSMPAPTAFGLRELTYKVMMGGYDLGIAFDGDGDRIGIIDPTGIYYDANSILMMLYWYLHEKKGWKGPVVRNIATTHLLDKMAESFGERCYEVPVGFKYVSAKIDETDALIGGESSGGMTVRGHIYGKDSIYAASLFVEMLSVTGMTPAQIMGDLHSKYGDAVFGEKIVNLSVSEKAHILDLVMMQKAVPDFSSTGLVVDHVSYLDGCKVYFTDGSFVICRMSGTEPVLRIMAETPTANLSQQCIDLFYDLVMN